MKGNKAVTVVLSVVLWVVILLAAFFAFATLATRDDNSVGSFLGYTPLRVQTESMSPTFEAGDMIIIKKCDPDKLEVGDIITFHTIIENQFALNTHRIAEIKTSGTARAFVTRGDNNLIEDARTISGGDIVGKYVTRLAGVGKVMDFLSGPIGFFLVIVLPMLAFFIYQVYHLVMVSISLKKATALEAAQEAQSAVTGDADAKMSEAEAALAEANRLKAELEAKLKEVESIKNSENKEE